MGQKEHPEEIDWNRYNNKSAEYTYKRRIRQLSVQQKAKDLEQWYKDRKKNTEE